MAKITTIELEEMIRQRMSEQGIGEGEIDQELIEQMKTRIKDAVNSDMTAVPDEEEEENIVLDVSPEQPTDTPGEAPEPITADVETSEEMEDATRKEGEMDERERELARREEALTQKETELGQKEAEMAHQPELPKFIEDMGPAKMFVFDENEFFDLQNAHRST